MLRYLAERYDVHLGCFVDDKSDFEYVQRLKTICRSVSAVWLSPTIARMRSAIGLLRNTSLTAPFYRHREMHRWIGQVTSDNEIEAIIAFSSPMGQYVLGEPYNRYVRIMDFVDIDSDKWRQFANTVSHPMRWIYSREARLLADFERRLAREFDFSSFVSEHETATFGEKNPDCRENLITIRNGVDTEFFDPAQNFESPFDEISKNVVFTGLMNYWPNVDAVRWFSEDILPLIREAVNDISFWIVGASPTSEVARLADGGRVQVTGRVPDVRPYLQHANLVVAPLRVARGVQNKVLEALAMNQTVICSEEAAAGLSGKLPRSLAIASGTSQFAETIVDRLNGPYPTVGDGDGRKYVFAQYHWGRNLQIFSELIERGTRTRANG